MAGKANLRDSFIIYKKNFDESLKVSTANFRIRCIVLAGGSGLACSALVACLFPGWTGWAYRLFRVYCVWVYLPIGWLRANGTVCFRFAQDPFLAIE